MKVGDLVRVRVVGMGAYMRALHDDPAMIVQTHTARGKELRRWKILWRDGVREMEPSLLVPLDPVQPDHE